MPPYNANPGVNTFPPLLQPGVNGYAFGSFDASSPTSLLEITNLSISGNVATALVILREGKVPTVGSLITIRGTTISSGVFNVNNVAVATVSIDATTAIGFITFILVHADVAATPDTGMAYVPVPEVGETLAAGASQAFAVPDYAGENDNGKTITWRTSYPSPPSGVTMQLQAAMFDVEAQYKTIDSSTTTSGEMRSLNLRVYRFLRVNCVGPTGGSSPTAVVTISI